jgi:hypothetical protein
MYSFEKGVSYKAWFTGLALTMMNRAAIHLID